MTRQEAIEAIKANYPPKHYSILCEALDMAMDVMAASTWIPCSEKLPGRFETVLISISDRVTGNQIVETGSYDHQQRCWLIDAQMPNHKIPTGERVDAWMPLPEPYKERDDAKA